MPEIDRFQGEVTASLKSIGETQTLIREEFQRSQEENTRQHEKMFTSLENTKLGMVEVKTALSSHIGEDNRRFRIVWRWLFVLGGIASLGAVVAKVLA